MPSPPPVPPTPPPVDRLPLGRIDVVLAPASWPSTCRIGEHELFRNQKQGGGTEIAPGRHAVTCFARHGGAEYGLVTQHYDVRPGEHVVVHYAAPAWLYAKGSMGLVPQRRSAAPNWKDIGVAVVGVLVLVALIGLIAFVASLVG